jgi:hypothetical protein
MLLAMATLTDSYADCHFLLCARLLDCALLLLVKCTYNVNSFLVERYTLESFCTLEVELVLEEVTGHP